MHNKVLLVIIAISLLLGASTLTRGHEWGDDFASYVMQTESILQGTTQEFVEQNSFTIFESSNKIGPVAYPWGYPVLLTPAYALKGNHPLALKLPSLFFYAGFLACLYLLMKTHLTATESLIVTALFGFNPMLLGFLDHIASDIPFLFFSTLALLLMVLKGQHGILHYVATGVAIAGAFFIRTTGILLLASFLAVRLIELWNNRNYREVLTISVRNGLVVAMTVGFLWMLYAALFPGGGESYFAQYQDMRFETALGHIRNYFLVFGQFFGEQAVWKIVYFVCLIFFVLGAWTRRKEDLLFIIFFVVWMLVLISWPSWQGPRFIFPLLPIFIYFTFEGIKSILKKLPKEHSQIGQWGHYGAWSLIAITFLVSSSLHAYANLKNNREINGPYDSYSNEVYDYIKENTPADSVIIFFKPRAMSLMTDRNSILSTTCDRILKGDYLVLSKKVGRNQQIPPEDIGACDLPLDEVLANTRFVVYEIQE